MANEDDTAALVRNIQGTFRAFKAAVKAGWDEDIITTIGETELNGTESLEIRVEIDSDN